MADLQVDATLADLADCVHNSKASEDALTADDQHASYPEASNPREGMADMAGSTREQLGANVQQLINDLNRKRKQDMQMMEDFKKAAEMNVKKSCNVVEHTLFEMYDKQGKLVQSKLQEIFATFERIAQIETELVHFKQLLGRLYQDMHQD